MRISRRLSSLIHFHNIPKWPGEVLKAVEASCSVRPNFISEEEEKCILTEVEPHMKRLRYEKSHWDDAIHLYREREQRKWSETSEKILQRVRETSFPKEAHHLTHVHILDLHKDGVIKPHIDSIRYCGDIITGISLLSDCVMRLRHKDQKDLLMVDLMLPRRSLYILGGPGRYDFTHEVLSEEESVFEERKVARGRRISIICRDLPKKENIQQQGEEIRLQPIPVNEMAFPLHCETYQIGKRTYRRNPYKHSASRKIYSDVGDTPDLYPEDDEGDDGPSCAVNSYGEKNCDVAASEEPRIVIERQPAKIETPEGEIISVEDSRISIIQGKWTAEIDVPPFAHSKLIGIRGKNLRELQDNTGCRVDIPRRGVKGPVVVRSKDGIESVQRCLELIQAVVDQGKAHARFTHFTAFACNQPAVLERYKVFREAVMTSATISETAKDEDLFIKPDRLHLTISMLWILELVDEMKAKLTLDAAGEEISKLLNGKPVKVSIKGLSIMNDDPAHVDVLYAVISGEHIQNISNIVYKHMVEAGLSPVAEADVSTTAEPVKLHLTLMNSRKQAEKTGKKRRSFDATELLKEFKDYDFGTITIDKISICSLKSVDVGGYYTELSSISL